MAGIKAGDDGTVLEFPIRDAGVIVPLNNTTVTIVFKIGDRDFEKIAQITDATNGLCEVVMTREDVANAGTYHLQGIVRKSNGNEFASDIEKLPVGRRL